MLEPHVIESLLTQAVDAHIKSYMETLRQDPVWLAKIEQQINQAVVDRTVATVASIDVNTIIHQRVDELMQKKIINNFSSTGIEDKATQCQLTVMDDAVVIETQLTTQNINVVGTARVEDLTVLGSINVDNTSWNTLADAIGQKTLDKVNDQWKQILVDQVVEQIRSKGIDFSQVTVEGQPLIAGNRLADSVTESNIQAIGQLRNLSVAGETHIYDTLSVVNGRLGINTQEPESALSIWDEEVSVIIGKSKSKQAYIGTSRDQTLTLGVNRTPFLEIDASGLTSIKQLQIGVHKISHATEPPGWAGTKGDIVFNSNFNDDRVFAWICLGNYKWQTLKAAL
jgi:hypothetical protein